MNKKLIIILIIILILLVLIIKSSFRGLDGVDREYSCEKDNRLYPSGNISGDYLNLNPSERNKLLVDFIKNGNTT
jgi:hypothetical protein